LKDKEVKLFNNAKFVKLVHDYLLLKISIYYLKH